MTPSEQSATRRKATRWWISVPVTKTYDDTVVVVARNGDEARRIVDEGRAIHGGVQLGTPRIRNRAGPIRRIDRYRKGEW